MVVYSERQICKGSRSRRQKFEFLSAPENLREETRGFNSEIFTVLWDVTFHPVGVVETAYTAIRIPQALVEDSAITILLNDEFSYSLPKMFSNSQIPVGLIRIMNRCSCNTCKLINGFNALQINGSQKNTMMALLALLPDKAPI